MSARPEEFFEQDSENGTFHAELPTMAQLMIGVYKRRIQHGPRMEVITQTSSGETPDEALPYTDARISATEPDAKRFGVWLESYGDKMQRQLEGGFETAVSSDSKPRRLREYSLVVQRKNNQAAIDLIQSWLEEEPDEQQASDLVRLKETIDEQRIEGRKLFK